MIKRCFDIGISLIFILCFSPFYLIISLLIIIDTGLPVLFYQERVGKGFEIFRIIKFRTMKPDSERSGQITVGSKDQRITGIGYYLRRFKIDETPQFINVFVGDMSLVGPRPEVPKYVDLYTESQKEVLSVKPGITDYASVKFLNENELLDKAADPEQEYRDIILPEKLKLNLQYIHEANFCADISILIKTFFRIIKN